MPDRIQLSGCYIHYQPDGVETSRVQLLHKTCSKHKLKKGRFEEVKYEAFAEVENGVLSGNGFYETVYELIHVMAQCEENLGACECGECVSSAAQIAEEECKYSISGEVYLDSCFISYKYHGDEFGSYSDQDDKEEGRSTKLIAIVIGGITAFSLGITFCFLMRSCGKKKDDW
ncbi:Cysteine-rich repeat secretory protein 39 [Abeliophyllum distichum]|uniref:Cysteine-rich repeat secretory protein 39 n=1 Tax=Abeliophyllum distichum TaxID=126358 RepID=A0ABD1UMP6_9LAMI